MSSSTPAKPADPLRKLELILAESDERIPKLALRPKNAALSLDISERLLWSKTKSGEISHTRINRTVVYPVDLLRQYLIQNAKGGVPDDHEKDSPEIKELYRQISRLRLANRDSDDSETRPTPKTTNLGRRRS